MPTSGSCRWPSNVSIQSAVITWVSSLSRITTSPEEATTPRFTLSAKLNGLSYGTRVRRSPRMLPEVVDRRASASRVDHDDDLDVVVARSFR